MKPVVTVAFLSWNRLHYLKATLASARLCISYPNVEWIVSDNDSDEPGVREYLSEQKWIDRLIVKRQSHADAMNQIASEAKGEYLLLWPDDVQFVVSGCWLESLIEVLSRNPKVGSVTLDALRRNTLNNLFEFQLSIRKRIAELYWYRWKFRRTFEAVAPNGFRVRGLGWRASGISGPGIVSLTRLNVWRALGPWRTRGSNVGGLVDSSMGAEEYMYNQFHLSRMPLQSAICYIPVAADIITDPTGCKAKVRGQYRYGVYMPPPSPEGLYYRIHELTDLLTRTLERPLSFADMVEPLGFHIPTDAQGDRLKYPLNTSVVFDITNGQEVKYPLTLPSRK